MSEWEKVKKSDEDRAVEALIERFTDESLYRWCEAITSPEDSGWWGTGPGFFLGTVVEHPGYWGQDLRIWVGLDHAHIQVMSQGNGAWWLEEEYRMKHDNLMAYLDSLPKPFTAYGVEEINNEEVK